MDSVNWHENQRLHYHLHESNPSYSTGAYAPLHNAPLHSHYYQSHYSIFPNSNPNDSEKPISQGLYPFQGSYGEVSQSLPAAPAAGTPQFPSLNPLPDWAMMQAVRQLGLDPISYGFTGASLSTVKPVVIPNSNSQRGLHNVVKQAIYRRPKKIKVAKSLWCEICKIDCNSKDVFDHHVLGKKHKRNVESKKAGISNTISAGAAPGGSLGNMVGNTPGTTENKKKTVAGNAAKMKGAPPVERGDNLETRKWKLMEGGAPAESVRVCAVCNVACNSDAVFQFHLKGQKHLTRVKKHAGGQ